MSSRLRKPVLWFVVIVLILPMAAYRAADAWLESSGGRQMLEQALTDRIGMTARITGEFDLMLLPDIGVSGTGLVIGEQADGGAFASSSVFEVSIALKPLLDNEVQVEWIRLTDGQIDPAFYLSTGGQGERGGIKLPRVTNLSIRDFEIILPGGEGNNLQVRKLQVSDFSENSETPFNLEIAGLVKVVGRLRWDTGQSRVRLLNLQLDLEGQRVNGEGCLIFTSPVSINAVLQAGLFDLDVFRQLLPESVVSNTDSGGGAGLALEVNARIAVDELRTKGVVARGVMFSVGGEPLMVCGAD